MVWGKRQFTGTDYVPYFNRLEKLLMSSGTLYPEFIMVSTKTTAPQVSIYWVGVPDDTSFTAFDGFEKVEEGDLPKEIDTLLIADATKEPFTSRFKFVHR